MGRKFVLAIAIGNARCRFVAQIFDTDTVCRKGWVSRPAPKIVQILVKANTSFVNTTDRSNVLGANHQQN